MEDIVDKKVKASNNPLFNLLALKYKLLVNEIKCDKCKQSSRLWTSIGVCHDRICFNCWDPKTKIKHCPLCKIEFNQEEHIITSENMNAVYMEIEEFLFKFLSLKNNTFNYQNKSVVDDDKTESEEETESDNEAESDPADGINGIREGEVLRERRNRVDHRKSEEAKNEEEAESDPAERINGERKEALRAESDPADGINGIREGEVLRERRNRVDHRKSEEAKNEEEAESDPAERINGERKEALRAESDPADGINGIREGEVLRERRNRIDHRKSEEAKNEEEAESDEKAESDPAERINGEREEALRAESDPADGINGIREEEVLRERRNRVDHRKSEEAESDEKAESDPAERINGEREEASREQKNKVNRKYVVGKPEEAESDEEVKEKEKSIFNKTEKDDCELKFNNIQDHDQQSSLNKTEENSNLITTEPDLFDEVQEIQQPEEECENELSFSGCIPISNSSDDQEESTKDNIDDAKQGKYLENTTIKRWELNSATMLSSYHINNTIDSQRSYATNDRSRNSSSNLLLEMNNVSQKTREGVQKRPPSNIIVPTVKRQKRKNSSESVEEDVIEGTPEKSGFSDSSGFCNQNRNIVLALSNLCEKEDFDILKNFIRMFKIEVLATWNDRVTHLVVKTKDGACVRSTKYTNALLANCFIVDFEWVERCLNSMTLLSELDYIPPDQSGQPSPLVSWRAGQGIITSPMDWTKHCSLYFHDSVKIHSSFKDIVIWAEKAGFRVTNTLAGFESDELRMLNLRIILADIAESDSATSSYPLPSSSEIQYWMNNYKAVTLFLDWFLECLFQYRFVKVEFKYQVKKLNPKLIALTEISDSVFELEDI